MKLKVSTHYAIQMLCFMNEYGRTVTVSEMERALGTVSGNYMRKLLFQMMQCRLVTSELGRDGGYRLARKADSISIYDIVMAIEGELVLSQCLCGECLFGDNLTDHCPARVLIRDLQDTIVTRLKETNISDLCANNQDFRMGLQDFLHQSKAQSIRS